MAYIPNVQFAPFYVADAKGYFADEGIKVTFDYGFEQDVVALTAQNQLLFTNAGAANTLIARAQGVPIRYFVNQYQTLPVALFAPRAKGFTTIADLKGHTIGYPGPFGDTYIGLKLMLQKSGLKESDVNLVNVGFTQAQSVLAGKVDAAVGYSVNEPVQVAAQGMPVAVWDVKEYTPEVAGTGMIASESTLKNQGELAKGFARAFLRGMADTINNPDEAFAISEKVVPEIGKDEQVKKTQRQVLQLVVDNYWRPRGRLGASDVTLWDKMQQDMLDAGLVTTTTDTAQAFSNDFLP